MKEFKCSYILDLERYNEFIKGYRATRTKNYILKIFVLIWLIIEIMQRDYLFVRETLLVVFIMLFVLIIVNIISGKKNLQYKRLVSQNNGVPITNEVTIDETGIHVVNIDTNNKQDYLFEQILSITETKNLLILKMEYGLGLILNKNNLEGGSREEVIEFLFEKCKNIKNKKVYKGKLGGLFNKLYVPILAILLVISIVLSCTPNKSYMNDIKSIIESNNYYMEDITENYEGMNVQEVIMFNKTFGHFGAYIFECDDTKDAIHYYEYWCSLQEENRLTEEEIKERKLKKSIFEDEERYSIFIQKDRYVFLGNGFKKYKEELTTALDEIGYFE